MTETTTERAWDGADFRQAFADALLIGGSVALAAMGGRSGWSLARADAPGLVVAVLPLAAALVAYGVVRRLRVTVLTLGSVLLTLGFVPSFVRQFRPASDLDAASSDLLFAVGLPLLAAGLVLGHRRLLAGLARHRDAEAQAARREREAASLFEMAPMGFFEADADGVVLRANQAMHRVLGRAPGTLTGFRVEDLGWEETPLPQPELDGGPVPVRFSAARFRHPDGSEREIELLAREIPGPEGRPGRTLTAVSDVTLRNQTDRERDELRNRMEQNQRLETIGTLAGGIAHDFNNLLAPIMGYVEMALAEVDESSPIRDDLIQVKAAADRARDLVAQILHFSRPQREGLHPVLIQSVTREVTGLLRASLPTTIGLVQHIDSTAPPVLGKATQVHQVLFNLCTNASHAMPDGGTITVTLDQTDGLATLDEGARPEAPGPYVRLRVRDTGTGMPPEVVEKVFQPFFTTKTLGTGTGLGLSVVQGIVEAMRGSITVDSQVGVGTTFTILLPIHTGEAEEGQAATELLQRPRDGHLLVVDDDAAVLRVMSRGLTRLGYRVTAFESSLEAVESFRAAPDAFDLVLTDEVMPEMTGRQLAREIRSRRSDIPIVLTTGYTDLVTEEHLGQIGSCTLLLKPASPTELGKVVARSLSSARG